MVSKYWGSPQPRIDTRTRTRIVKCPSSGHQLQVPIISASSHFTSVMRRTNLEIVSAHKECWLRFSVSSRRLILYRITITRAVSGAFRNFTMPGGGPLPFTCLKCILALSWRRTKISRSLVDSSSYHGYCSLQFWNEKKLSIHRYSFERWETPDWHSHELFILSLISELLLIVMVMMTLRGYLRWSW